MVCTMYDTKILKGGLIEFAYKTVRFHSSTMRHTPPPFLHMRTTSPRSQIYVRRMAQMRSTTACSSCASLIDFAIDMEGWDEYDIRQSGSGLYPPSTYGNYYSDPAITKAIGARGSLLGVRMPRREILH
jgi:hypothetical protein